MAFTQSDLDNLKKAIADGRGARTISFSDQSVTFHSVEEMHALLAMMQRDVNVAAAKPTTRYATTDKGV